MTVPVSDESPSLPARPALTESAADEPTAAGPRYRGWYWLGIVIQVCVWTLIWLGIAIAIGVGGELTEFRYVGF